MTRRPSRPSSRSRRRHRCTRRQPTARAGVPLSATLKWEGGSWAQKYDIYFGASATPPLLARDVVVGSAETGVAESYTVQNLAPGTTYYWKIVGKTMANRSTAGPVWSFTTAAAGGATSDIVLYAGSATTKAGNWQVVADATAAGGSRMYQPDRGAGKVAAPLSAPANYFEMSFNAQAGVPYQVVDPRQGRQRFLLERLGLAAVHQHGRRDRDAVVAHRLRSGHLDRHRGVLGLRGPGLGLARQRLRRGRARRARLLRDVGRAEDPCAAARGRHLDRPDPLVAVHVPDHLAGPDEERHDDPARSRGDAGYRARWRQRDRPPRQERGDSQRHVADGDGLDCGRQHQAEKRRRRSCQAHQRARVAGQLSSRRRSPPTQASRITCGCG